jgi:hypothetical protein
MARTSRLVKARIAFPVPSSVAPRRSRREIDARVRRSNDRCFPRSSPFFDFMPWDLKGVVEGTQVKIGCGAINLILWRTFAKYLNERVCDSGLICCNPRIASVASLVADAAWKGRRVRLKRGAVDLVRGQLLASSRFLAERWQWPEPRVRRFVDRISGRRANDAHGDAPNDAQIDALIDALPTANGTIITIRNYDSFQKEAKPEPAPTDATIDAHGDAPNDAPHDAKSTQREEEINNNTLLKESGDARATRIPSDFDLDDETQNWAIGRLGTVSAVGVSIERFRNHYSQVAGDRGLSRDWQAKARNWIDDDARKQRSSGSSIASVACGATDDHWDGILKTYAQTGYWTRDVGTFGSEPASPACRAPRHLLVKHGLATTERAQNEHAG